KIHWSSGQQTAVLGVRDGGQISLAATAGTLVSLRSSPPQEAMAGLRLGPPQAHGPCVSVAVRVRTSMTKDLPVPRIGCWMAEKGRVSGGGRRALAARAPEDVERGAGDLRVGRAVDVGRVSDGFAARQPTPRRRRAPHRGVAGPTGQWFSLRARRPMGGPPGFRYWSRQMRVAGGETLLS